VAKASNRFCGFISQVSIRARDNCSPLKIGKLAYRYKKTNDAVLKAELDRLTAELERLPERWKFVARKEGHGTKKAEALKSR